MIISPEMLTHYHSGLSGLQLPISKFLYPVSYENASRLTYYSSIFNSIEINSSFYKIPKVATVSKWTKSVVKEDFKFTFKLWKGITHKKHLDFSKTDLLAFFASINAVENKKGCLLIQFPPSFSSEYITELNKLLKCILEINTTPAWKVAVEFRNKSWYNQSVYDLLNLLGVAIVIHDIPKSATPLINHSVNFIYIRFHGPTGNYRDSYSDGFISEYATYLKEWVEDGKTIYVYFNNTMGDAFNNLKSLNRMIF